MIGKKIKKEIKTPVMIGVVRIWTLERRGPPVGIVESFRPDEGVAVDVEVSVAVDDGSSLVDVGRSGNGRS
jgi:hypothetical protein